jgi:hypothetical protein
MIYRIVTMAFGHAKEKAGFSWRSHKKLKVRSFARSADPVNPVNPVEN